MVDVIYHLVARFRTIVEAEKAEKRSPVVLNELVEFHDSWQSIRGNDSKSVKERHEELLRRYPLVSRLIPLPSAKEDYFNMNHLVGMCEMYRGFTLRRRGTDILLSCYVSPLADWDNIACFFYKLGAVWVNWIQEEDSFDYCAYNGCIKMRMDFGRLRFSPTTLPDKLTEEELKEIDSLIIKKKLTTS